MSQPLPSLPLAIARQTLNHTPHRTPHTVLQPMSIILDLALCLLTFSLRILSLAGLFEPVGAYEAAKGFFCRADCLVVLPLCAEGGVGRYAARGGGGDGAEFGDFFVGRGVGCGCGCGSVRLGKSEISGFLGGGEIGGVVWGGGGEGDFLLYRFGCLRRLGCRERIALWRRRSRRTTGASRWVVCLPCLSFLGDRVGWLLFIFFEYAIKEMIWLQKLSVCFGMLLCLCVEGKVEGVEGVLVGNARNMAWHVGGARGVATGVLIASFLDI